MKYYKNGNKLISTIGTLDMPEITVEEYETEMAAVNKRMEVQTEIAEAHRPFTESEVTALLIKQHINTITVDDQTALRMVSYYPAWDELICKTVDKADFRFTYGGKLYKTIPANHTFQADWIPGVGTESLYTRIDEEHDGTQYDPIPYDGNMALEAGKYYIQDYVIYLCNRDTGNPVYNPLAELVGLYVDGVVG